MNKDFEILKGRFELLVRLFIIFVTLLMGVIGFIVIDNTVVQREIVPYDNLSWECFENVTVENHRYVEEIELNTGNCGMKEVNTRMEENYTIIMSKYVCEYITVPAYVEYFNESVCVKEHLVRDVITVR